MCGGGETAPSEVPVPSGSNLKKISLQWSFFVEGNVLSLWGLRKLLSALLMESVKRCLKQHELVSEAVESKQSGWGFRGLSSS